MLSLCSYRGIHVAAISLGIRRERVDMSSERFDAVDAKYTGLCLHFKLQDIR